MSDIAEIMGGDFATDSVPAASGFDPLPPGWYPVEIEKAEVKQNKAKNGAYLWLQMTTIGQDYNGRKLFARVTLANPNATAVEIGHRELAAIGVALGLPTIGSSEQVIGGQLQVKVAVRPAEGTNDADNEIKGYKALGEGTAAPAAKAAPAKTTTTAPKATVKAAPAATTEDKPAAAPKLMPWQRK